MAKRAALAKRSAPAVSPTRLAALQGAAARQGEEFGGELLGEHGELAGDARLDARKGRELLLEAGEPAGTAQSLRRHLEAEAEVVQVPAQAALDACAFADQVAAVVDEQTQRALGTREAGLG
jgi:hypothetical protein